MYLIYTLFLSFLEISLQNGDYKMQKKRYEEPRIEIIKFSSEDIITTSEDRDIWNIINNQQLEIIKTRQLLDEALERIKKLEKQ